MNHFLRATLFITLSLSLTACGQSISEKITEEMMETALEESGNTNANIDLSRGKMNITTEDGNYQLGTDAQWPSNFPSDVYKIDGTVMSSLSNSGENAYWVMVSTNKSIADATNEFKNHMEKNAWKITMTATYGEVTTLGGEKDGRKLAVVLAPADGKTNITINETK